MSHRVCSYLCRMLGKPIPVGADWSREVWQQWFASVPESSKALLREALPVDFGLEMGVEDGFLLSLLAHCGEDDMNQVMATVQHRFFQGRRHGKERVLCGPYVVICDFERWSVKDVLPLYQMLGKSDPV